MEQLPVRSYAAGVLLATLVTFTGTLGYRVGSQRLLSPAPARVAEAAAHKPEPVQAQAAPSAAAPAPAPAPEGPAHTVKAGETLFGIARLHGVTVDVIRQANGLPGDQIREGQLLKVPGGKPARTYKMQAGDSLWELALRYDLSLDDLLASNPQVDNPGHLQIGQEIILPATGGAPSQAVAPAAAPQLVGVFAWPNTAPISSPFGPRDGRNHNGIDLAANMGDPIKAARDGQVVLSGTVPGYGLTVILKHEDGTQTLYAHASRLRVKAGDRVKQGDTIADVGSTGRSTGPHLHFEILVNNKASDPLLYLPKNPQR